MSPVNPFIGIRPFTEADGDRFHGRKAVSEALINLIRQYQITILTGPSGYGKSSLVNCGVIRPMKQGRLEQRPGFARQPFVVRDWGQVRGDAVNAENIGALFAEILKREGLRAFNLDAAAVGEKAAAGVEAERAKFLEVFSEIESELGSDPDAFIDLVSDISRVFKGIVLVFDQFEEILRVGPNAVREVSNLVVQMASVPGVKIMLSLREEYHGALRLIERQAGPLAQSTIHLGGMSFDDAKSVFRKMARGPEETPSIDLKPELLDFLNTESSAEADLFYYQAILSEIWTALNESGQSTEVMDVSSLTKAFGSDVGDNPKKAFECALLRIVDSCFLPVGEDRNRSLRCRSHAIRVAPWLSSGGFKTTQREEDLFDKAYGEAMSSSADKPLEEITSGSFKIDHKETLTTYQEVEKILRDEYVEMLQRLDAGNVLKRYGAGAGSSRDTDRAKNVAFWELTHDRLGDPLYAWSRAQLNCIGDNRSASLASWGVTPLRVNKHQSINPAHKVDAVELSQPSDWRKLNWRGCSVEPGRTLTPDRRGAKPKARFREIEFIECDFRGSVFVNCTFENCKFTACHLSGSAFIDCKFNECEFRDLTKERGATIGFLGCEFEKGMTFSNCSLIQLTIEKKGTKVDASGILFRGCEIESSRFSDRDSQTSKGQIVLEGSVQSLNWFQPESNWGVG